MKKTKKKAANQVVDIKRIGPICLFAGIIALALIVPVRSKQATSSDPRVLGEGGFDNYGYNDKARIFNGTGLSWCMAKFSENSEYCEGYIGDYANDKLIMKWNAEWDRGNAEGWSEGPYKAWTSNEWNGMKNGSGEVWHYKIVWVGTGGESSPYWVDGGYSIWGQFEVIMDQGKSPGGQHFLSKGTPAGYGARFAKTEK